jgi:hypothetical protein
MSRKKKKRKQIPGYYVNQYLTSQGAWFLPSQRIYPGAMLKTMNFFGQIGAQIEAGIKFCIVCGQGSHRLDWINVLYPICDNHSEEDFVRAKGPVSWFGFFQKGATHVNDLVTPDDMPKLLFSQQAYNNLPDAKRRILFKLKKKSAVQTVNDTCTEIVWYLDPQVFIEMTTEYPWLLDRNLGEPVVTEDFWATQFGKNNP